VWGEAGSYGGVLQGGEGRGTEGLVVEGIPIDQRAATERSRELAKTNLEFLCREILWRNQVKKDWAPIHGDLKEFLKRPSRRKLILLPRNHLKSSVVTKAWSIQKVINDFNHRVLIASDTWENARKFLGSIAKYLVQSPLRYFFGNFQSDHWNQDEITVKQRTQILDSATIATTGIEKEQTSQHYDTIIADDVVARENVGTPEQRQKVKTYYRDLLDLLEPGGTLVVIGTRWHQDDLYSMLLEEEGWDVMVRTAYKNEERTELEYPQKFTLEYLAQLRASKGAYEFAAQYLNNPIDEEAADFKSSWIKFYQPGTPNPGSLYLTVDPGISLSREADFSALTVAGMFQDRRIRVVDRVRKRMIPSDLVNAIFELVKKWRLHRVGIETFAFQKTLKYEVQRQQRESGLFFSVDELGKRNTGRGEPVLSKEARIRRLQPYFEQGLVEIREDMQDLIDELLAFPRGRHDDLIDSLSYQLDYLVPSMEKSIPRETIHGSMKWWLDKVPEKSQTIYDRFIADGMK
jgi:predicted phage terminase large subunit-like protein